MDVMNSSPVRALTKCRGRKRIIMSNSGMMTSRGNGTNSEGNLPHCACVLGRLMVMKPLSAFMQFIKVKVLPVELVSVVILRTNMGVLILSGKYLL